MTPLTIKSTLDEIWQKAKSELSRVLPKEAFDSWFSNMECVGGDDDKILLGTPSALAQYWIADNFFDLLTQNLSLAAAKNMKFEIVTLESEVSTEVVSDQIATHFAQARPQRRNASRSVQQANTEILESINPRNTFENFVVGEGNQFAHSAALAVAQSPGVAFNPLFLHGSTGLGKTHLMHAIAHFIIKNNPSSRVLFISSETFVNDYLNALTDKNIAAFHQKYRSVDVLLIDDIQFLSGKASSQKEFFHAFNRLLEARKQIILSCDKSPSEVEDIEERLVSRFEWGICVGIDQPDFETRLAILRRKLATMGDSVKIAPEVLELVARRFTKNVRRMEGALNKLIGYCSLINSSEVLTLEKSMYLLADALNAEDGGESVDVEKIKQVVAGRYNISVDELCGRRRTQNIAEARQIAMYLTKKLTSNTLQEVGKKFGGRDHGTVMHAIKVVEDSMKQNESFSRTVEWCKKSISM